MAHVILVQILLLILVESHKNGGNVPKTVMAFATSFNPLTNKKSSQINYFHTNEIDLTVPIRPFTSQQITIEPKWTNPMKGTPNGIPSPKDIPMKISGWPLQELLMTTKRAQAPLHKLLRIKSWPTAGQSDPQQIMMRLRRFLRITERRNGLLLVIRRTQPLYWGFEEASLPDEQRRFLKLSYGTFDV